MKFDEYIGKPLNIGIKQGEKLFFYTGEIIEEDTDSIKFKDNRGNVFVIAKEIVLKIEIMARGF